MSLEDFFASEQAEHLAEDAARAARSAARAAASASPRPVTRGESLRSEQRVKIDWLNATFPSPGVGVPAFIAQLSKVLGRKISAEEGGGIFGFSMRANLVGHYGSRKAAMGCLAWGGEQQNGRWMLQLTGVGCSMVPSWPRLRTFLERLQSKLTRLDLALDFLQGEYSVDDAVAMYLRDEFTLGGRKPSSEYAGDWLGLKNGRTFYVGKAKNGKGLRVYEKGRQLGDTESPWVRFEVQLGNRDRLIPFEALTERDAFFAGCYPALEAMIEEAAIQIETEQKGGEVTVAHLLRHAMRCYGKLLDVVLHTTGVSHADLVEEVRVIGLPRRINPSSLAAGLTWDQLLSQLRS